MSALRPDAARRPSAGSAAAKSFPIADPDLARLSELLHRMAICQSLAPFQWMAGEGIQVLRAYVAKQGEHQS
ncbi:hypothetical protein [Paraburkholderia caballeronis]|uniref:hypothetical protein n=1 Tax=Paraburkholderia caballeronis TaxID=416943 RepID=UPI001064B4B9|nr:hypothetical protein [Paraburkholderia caballeronis]TDV04661.1 hypothetical protein C7408_13123 [Paraburkholderia caballeronis]TDV07904.1 hypothetical protein C7406_13323 [Paraburkholderia caballeronis]TDV18195.1 hypothetical protein C7404_13123 [Paraburkholderia caballeronis]